MNALLSRIRLQTNCLVLRKHWNKSCSVICAQREYRANFGALNNLNSRFLPEVSLCSSAYKGLTLQPNRSFAKWKKSKAQNEVEESDEEDNSEDVESEEVTDDYNLISKNVASLRLDTILKAGLGMSKKKIEKDFYVGKVRINGEKVQKKSSSVHIDYELDVVHGPSPENIKMLLVDRIIIKSIGKVNDNGNFPIKMQVFKKLTVENYNDPWVKSSLEEED